MKFTRTSRLALTKWYEYAIRLLFGEIVTAITVDCEELGPQGEESSLAFPDFSRDATRLGK